MYEHLWDIHHCPRFCGEKIKYIIFHDPQSLLLGGIKASMCEANGDQRVMNAIRM